MTGIKDANAVTKSAGTEFKITCQFEAGATKVMWYQAGSKVKEDVPANNATEVKYTIASVAGSNSGVYSCQVTYTGVDDPYTGRQTKSLNVRGKSADAIKHASVGTASVTLTCVFYGDEMNTATWHKAGSADAEKEVEGKTAVNAGTYSSASNSLTTTLQISGVATSDGAAYTCKTTYKSDNAASQSIQTLSLLAKGKLFT